MSEEIGRDTVTQQDSVDGTWTEPATNDLRGTASSASEPRLVPEVVEIRLDYTKDAVQMAKGGCRRWK